MTLLRREPVLTLLLICLYSVGSLSAQVSDTLSPKRPKIGLVLSGGGAKGLAHVGVIRVLEQCGIIPDMITGTSMGSVVGGLYASGYSSQELSAINASSDWEFLLSDRVPLTAINIEEKSEYYHYLAEFTVRNLNIELPSGVIQGQQIDNYFLNLFLPVVDITDFDSLPIPFRCVSVDLLQGDVVVHKSGDLPLALRSSMAIPSIFTPVRWEDRLLVDGGVIRNFPVQEVRDMGADIVIGVYVGGTSADSTEYNSLLSILSYMTFFVGSFDSKEQFQLLDYLMWPDLKGYSAASFSSSGLIEERGRLSADSFRNVMVRLADSLDQIAPRAPVIRKNAPDSLWINQIEITGNNWVSDKLIQDQLGISPGNWLTRQQMNDGRDLLYGLRYFDKIHYYFEPQGKGYKLHVQVIERPPNRLKLSLYFDSDYNFSLIAGLVMRNLVFPDTRLALKGEISRAPRIKLAYSNYFGPAKSKVGYFRALYENNPYPILSGERVIGSLKQDLVVLDVGFRELLGLNLRSGLGLRYEFSKVNTDNSIQDELVYGFRNWRFQNIHAHLFLEWNTLNKQYFPTRGLKLSLDLRGVLAMSERVRVSEDSTISAAKLNQDPYAKALLDITHYNQFGEKWTLEENLTLATTFGDSISVLDGYFLGGMGYNLRYQDRAFWGFQTKQLFSPEFITGRFVLSYRINSVFRVQGAINAAHLGFNQEQRNFGSFVSEGFPVIFGGGFALQMNTLLGPIALSVTDNTFDWTLRLAINAGFTF
ncbi:patatin-like phospholipase family protein [Pontibacter sp. G13]|uniref:patatin-like phospholipase family protein n=1 Tax=Pontibacter sp. G13 TaxID=3074898 RepID=UPI00288B9EDD|nr:patatin-like phospholipase family protein [Pontibacter sp. G13]WNJ21098.1 patatin-like phospholipase family protein [Pontibacter sp. G13]